ncbi:MAG TPA: histidinol dehydrogenase [Haliangiales bacterium]|nr:histidinol dehydrogenase [Haliangiales bacterium]
MRIFTLPADQGPVQARFRRNDAIPAEIEAAARAIVGDVRARGDAAVAEHTARFEGRSPDPVLGYEIPRERWDAEADRVAPPVRAALSRAVARVAAFHERQREGGYDLDEDGVRLVLRVEPLARVGLYVPGGTARYPSSVVMTAVPARVAGVRDIVMVTPGASPETLCAARLCGVDRAFEIGGAQAVAALAYGTATVPRVDKIVGPGNAYVAAAKRIVFGDVDIDSIAGPTEVLIVADDSADAAVVAADLLAQAEHDVLASPILVTPSAALAHAVVDAVARQLPALSRRAIAEKAVADRGAVVVTRDLDEALLLADRYAPEHLGLHIRDAARFVDRIRNAGAIFVGPHTPEAAGDYLAGPNHVLPTGGAARFASPLGVYDYVKRISVLEYTAGALASQADDIIRLAEAEGLTAHARSVTIRTKP